MRNNNWREREKRKYHRGLKEFVAQDPTVTVKVLANLFDRTSSSVTNTLKELGYEKHWVYVGDKNDSKEI